MIPEKLQSDKLENAVLSTLIWQQELRPVLMPKLTAETFTVPYRIETFEGIQSLYDAGKEIDLLTVEQWLKDNKEWETSLIDVFNTKNAAYSRQESIVDDLNDRRTRRDILSALESILDDLRNEAKPAAYFLGELDKLINGNLKDAEIPGLNYSQVMEREANKPDRQKLYISDPFMQNTFFGKTGFHKGEILVPFADTGHGKTYFAVYLASQLLRTGHKGVFIIRESRAKKLFERFERAIDDKSLLDNLIVADIEQGISNLDDVVSTIKYHNAVSDVDFFVVDHLKILPVEGLSEWEERKKITTCINRLIYLSQEVNALGIPISQVNRKTLSNARGWQKDPKLQNLYGSSAIEQAAHMAVSIFRPSQYDELCSYDYRGELEYVKGPNYGSNPSDKHSPNSVFIRQRKVREGKLYRRYVKFLHTDKGLVRNQNETESKSLEDEAPF